MSYCTRSAAGVPNCAQCVMPFSARNSIRASSGTAPRRDTPFGAAQALLVRAALRSVRSRTHSGIAPRAALCRASVRLRAIAVIESPAPVAVGEVADAAQLRLARCSAG